MAQRTQSITASTSGGVRHQSASGAPAQEFVTVAVLPPRLPPDMASPTGVGTADAFSWDEAVNWSHNQKINQTQPDPKGAHKFMRKIGVSTERKKANEMPPFIMRKVPYDTWRKHYAKDKEGRFQGTGTPAEDCLLLPEDVAKWRFGEPETKGDQWTRGKAALPAYTDAPPSEPAPLYSKEAPPADSTLLRPTSSTPQRASSFTADGKTSEQIIQEALERERAKKAQGGAGWKNTMKRATEYAMMGAGN